MDRVPARVLSHIFLLEFGLYCALDVLALYPVLLQSTSFCQASHKFDVDHLTHGYDQSFHLLQ